MFIFAVCATTHTANPHVIMLLLMVGNGIPVKDGALKVLILRFVGVLLVV